MLDYLIEIFKGGMPYLVKRELSDEERAQEVKFQLARGNHKSATSKLAEVVTLLEKDVVHGFCLPIASSVVHLIRGGMVQPCSVVGQFGIQVNGTWVLKERLTHNL